MLRQREGHVTEGIPGASAEPWGRAGGQRGPRGPCGHWGPELHPAGKGWASEKARKGSSSKEGGSPRSLWSLFLNLRLCVPPQIPPNL